MSKSIGSRLKEIADEVYDGNNSALARAIDMKPGSFYRYTSGDRSPGVDILRRLAEIGVNIHWLVTGNGPMLTKDIATIEEPVQEYRVKEPAIDKMIKMIVSRLETVDYDVDKKLDILKETLNQIAIEQNTYFVEKEIKSSKDK